MGFVIRNNTTSQILIEDLGQYIEASQELDLTLYHELDLISASLNSSESGSLGSLEAANVVDLLDESGGNPVPPKEAIQVIGLTEDERDALDNVNTPLDSNNPVVTDSELTTGLNGKADTSHDHTVSDVTDFNSAADARIAAQKGAVNGIAELDSSGKLPTSQLPPVAIADSFVVASESAMLSLSAQTGDIAVRTDVSKNFILQGSDPSDINDWLELADAGGGITSVNGDSGPTVVLDTDDISEGSNNEYYTDAKVASAPAVQANTAKVSADGSIGTHSDVSLGTPNVGDIFQWNGAAFVPASKPVFGTEFAYVQSLGMSTTTSTAYQQKMRLNLSNLPLGTYLLTWSYQWNHNAIANDFEARIQLDDSPGAEFIHKQEPKDSNGSSYLGSGSDQRHCASWQVVLSLSGNHFLDLDFRTSSAGVTSAIWNCCMTIWRVA